MPRRSVRSATATLHAASAVRRGDGGSLFQWRAPAPNPAARQPVPVARSSAVAAQRESPFPRPRHTADGSSDRNPALARVPGPPARWPRRHSQTHSSPASVMLTLRQAAALPELAAELQSGEPRVRLAGHETAAVPVSGNSAGRSPRHRARPGRSGWSRVPGWRSGDVVELVQHGGAHRLLIPEMLGMAVQLVS